MGLSFLFCIGRWGGLHMQVSYADIRITIGFLSFTIYFFDMDNYIAKQFYKIKELEEELKEKIKELKNLKD